MLYPRTAYSLSLSQHVHGCIQSYNVFWLLMHKCSDVLRASQNGSSISNPKTTATHLSRFARLVTPDQ